MSTTSVTARPPTEFPAGSRPAAHRGLDVHGSPRKLRRRGVAGAVLVLLAFGLFNVVAIDPFYAGDETAHVNYALELSEGRLPSFQDRYEPRIPGMTGDTLTWTAVHPPLYYVLAAPLLRLGVANGHAVGALWATRLLSVLLAAATVVLVARLAAALVPGRPTVAVASAGLLALTTSFQQVTAFVYNDALSLLATTGTLAVVVLAIRHGCGWRRTGLLALGAVVSAATRASGLEVAALAVVATASLPPHERPFPLPRRLRLVASRAAAVAGAVVVSTGWFYLRNQRRYGDPDGSTTALLDNPPGPSVLDNGLSGRFWLEQYGQLWGYVTGMNPLAGLAVPLTRALLAAVLGGLALAAVRWLASGARAARRSERIGARRRSRRAEIEERRRERETGAPGARSRLTVAWLTMAAHVLVVVLTVLSYFHRGAIPFGRYFFPALPLLVVVAAVGLDALPGRRAVPTILSLGAAVVTCTAMTGVVLAEMAPGLGSTLPGQLGGALAAAGLPFPGPTLVGLALLLGVGLWLVASSLTRLGRAGELS